MKYLGKITDSKDLVTKEYVDNADSTKQATLVSGPNIKTINNNSLLGSGNISISTGGTVDSAFSTTSENPVQNKVITNAFKDKADALSLDSNDDLHTENAFYINGDTKTTGNTVQYHITDTDSLSTKVSFGTYGNGGTEATTVHGIWSNIQGRWIIDGYNGGIRLGQTRFHELFQVSTGAVTVASLAANGYSSNTGSAVTKSGYYPIGIVGFDITGTGSGSVYATKYYLTSQGSGTCKVFAGLHNDSSTARTNITLTAYILWVKVL